MKRKTRMIIAACSFAAFVLWTAALCFVDVQPIGPQGSEVGFAALNSFVHGLTGVHMGLYVLTDWLSILPVCFVIGFAILGLCQWIKRKKLRLVDRSILVLGCLYVVVMVTYLLFETFAINFRPVLINGVLEPSYPSSTTLLVMCVIPTSAVQLGGRIKRPSVRRSIYILFYAFTIFMLVARLMSGVHWASDIIGGILLSSGYMMLYRSLCRW